MLPLWLLFVIPPVFLLASSLVSFSNNYRAAKNTGLPIVISPVERLNLAWVAFQKPLRGLLENLPFGLGSFVRYTTLSWYFEDKYRMHTEHGKVFMVVSPGMNELHSVDPDVNAQVFSRRKDFEKPKKILKAVAIYGDSIASVTDADWQRHRRITVPPFNERNNKLVWDESLSQASQLASYWSAQGPKGISSTTKDMATVTLNILATAAMGQSWKFRGAEGGSGTENEQDENMDYRQCLASMLTGIRLLFLTPLWVYSLPPAILPQPLRSHVKGYRQFEQFMAEMTQQKKKEVAAGQVSDDTFLNTIVSKSEEFMPQAESGDGKVSSASGGLSDSELYGNMFTFNFAGHETTAGSASYALYLLAAHPEVQEWAREEVLHVYKRYEGAGSADLSYDNLFPQLKRVLVVMYETLRLYNPVNSINKATVGPYGQELIIDGRCVRIPPNTMVAPNVIGSCTLPEHWGDDHLDWKPRRWIQEPSASEVRNAGDALQAENVAQPPKGKESFFPWSAGARVCPGKKFSQVEFVAIISRLLSTHRIEVVPRQGEAAEEARRRCLEVVNDSETRITLQMRQATSVRLRLVGLK